MFTDKNKLALKTKLDMKTVLYISNFLFESFYDSIEKVSLQLFQFHYIYSSIAYCSPLPSKLNKINPNFIKGLTEYDVGDHKKGEHRTLGDLSLIYVINLIGSTCPHFKGVKCLISPDRTSLGPQLP